MTGFLRSTLLLFSMHVGAILRSKRALVALLLAAFPPGLAWAGLSLSDGVHAGEIVTGISLLATLQGVLPILSLVAGSAVITEEVENRTITYLFTRPISRSGLLFGRWLATLVLVSSLLGLSALALLLVASGAEGELPPDFAQRFLWASLLGGAVYSLIFAVIGVFLKRSMILGLAYVFAFEIAIANIPSSTQALSIQHYLRGILVDPSIVLWRQLDEVGEVMGLENVLTPSAASATLAGVMLVAAVIGALGIRTKQYVLSA